MSSAMSVLASAGAAVHFDGDAFVTNRAEINGRLVASSTFFDNFLRHSNLPGHFCLAERPQDFERFAQRVNAVCGPNTTAHWVTSRNLQLLEEPGCLYQADPVIGPLTWQRRAVGSDSFSICGVTHTMSSAAAMESIGDLLVAPVEEWDAVVCTSHAIRGVVDHVLGAWSEYLGERLRATPRCPAALPVIPLGVDCASLRSYRENGEARKKARERWRIKGESIAVLSVGRLSFHAKAHPLPLYLALEEAVRRTRGEVVLLMVGWFANSRIADAFRQGAKAYCPSVRTVFVDGRNQGDLIDAWRAGDVFSSLVDNIQESFGLSPIEAMAAGLPSVVSDWNGYRDTIRHEVDGFRIPTVVPPAGAGVDLAWRYYLGVDTYPLYVGYSSQSVSVDIPSAADSFTALIANSSLRRSMGETAQRRADECFDWSVVISQYQELWSELAARRLQHATSATRTRVPHPLHDDPFTTFSGFSTRQLTPETRLERSSVDRARLTQFYRDPMTSFATELLAQQEELHGMLKQLERRAQTVAELMPADGRHAVALRSIGWLLKVGLVRLAGSAHSPMESNGRTPPSQSPKPR